MRDVLQRHRLGALVLLQALAAHLYQERVRIDDVVLGLVGPYKLRQVGLFGSSEDEEPGGVMKEGGGSG